MRDTLVIIGILYLLLVAGAVARVLTGYRQPVRALAWTGVLSLVPVVGLLLYYFFGQDTRKERVISRRSADQLTRRSLQEFAGQPPLPPMTPHEVLIRQFAQGGAMPFTVGQTDFFVSGGDFILSLLRDIRAAKHHIHLVSYIFAADALGHLVADALMDRAREGVEVRLVYDDVGCWRVPRRFFERMRGAGVEVRAFMPVHFPAFTSKINYRNHHKICVVDGRVGYVGGMNIALRYVRGTGGGDWRDLHCRVEGNAVYGLQQAFLTDWYFVDRTLISHRKYYPHSSLKNTPHSSLLTPHSPVAQVVLSSPVAPWPDIMQGYVRVLMEARRYVYMETPYFMPAEPVLSAIETAARAGVDVRLVVPLHPDSRLAGVASRSFLMQVREAGASVYMYGGGFIHSKLLVSDDALASVGSSNIDFRSFENNFECNLFLYGRHLAGRLRDIFLADQASSLPIEQTALVAAHRWPRRLWEGIIRLLSPLL